MILPDELEVITDVALVQKAAWVTARKTSGSKFTPEVFRDYLIAEHSPIRRFIIAWRYKKLLKRVSTHLARHIHQLPFVSSTRPDWFEGHEGDEIVDHLQDSNAQALIDMARKRLCFRAWKGTREAMEGIKYSLMHSTDPYLRVLGEVLVPNCVYRTGCPEGKRGCGWFVKSCILSSQTIEERYLAYNEKFRRDSGEITL
jgi:hypothetical protein